MHLLLEEIILVSIIRFELKGNFTVSFDDVISGVVLISVGVTTNNDGLGPSWDESGDVLEDNGLSEDGSIEDVSDGSIGGSPHLLKFELLNSLLIGGDGSALDSYLVELDGVSSINSHLIVGLVSVLNSQVVVFDIKVEIWLDVL